MKNAKRKMKKKERNREMRYLVAGSEMPLMRAAGKSWWTKLEEGRERKRHLLAILRFERR